MPGDGGSGGRPLRLAFLGDPNSGHTRRWIGFFLDRGHDAYLLVPAKDEISVHLDPRINVRRFEAWRRTRIPGMGSITTSRSLRRELRRVRPDVLHAHYVTRYAIAAWLSGFHPYVVTVWGSDLLLTPKHSRRRRVQARISLRAADLVTGGSDHLIRTAITAGARPERTQYVHFGVDTDKFSPGPDPVELRRRLGLEGRRVLLSNRGIAPLYRQRVVIEALAQLPQDVAAVMTRYSADPTEVAAVEARAAELGAADRLRIVPPLDVDEMPDLYRLADVVVSIPETDGGPTTIAEALAVGRPVVASDLPGAREWLSAADPESLVPVGDPAATAAAVRRILARDPAAEAERAAAARRAVVERAGVVANMERMEQLYRGLAARRDRSRARNSNPGRRRADAPPPAVRDRSR